MGNTKSSNEKIGLDDPLAESRFMIATFSLNDSTVSFDCPALVPR